MLLSLPKLVHRIDPAVWLLLPALMASLVFPLLLFYVQFFQETGYEMFLQVSFDRAFFPAAFLFTILVLILVGSKPVSSPS